jgi:hypothetical protein
LKISLRAVNASPDQAIAQEAFLVPVEVRLLVHLRPVFARRHGDRLHMHAIGFRALQQGHVLQRRLLDRRKEVGQHRRIGLDLLLLAPARNEPGTFVEGGIDQMGRAREVRRQCRTSRSIGKIERQPMRTERVVGLAPRERHDVAVWLRAEVFHRSIAHEAGRAGNYDFLCHRKPVSRRHAHLHTHRRPVLCRDRSGLRAALRRRPGRI